MSISEFKVGQSIAQKFYCVSKTEGLSKNGSTYYSVVLQDKSGSIDGKIWDMTSSIGNFEAKDFIAVEGCVTEYKGALQLTISRVSVCEVEDISEYCPTVNKDIDEMFKSLYRYIESINNEYLKKLLKLFFDNESFVARFKKSSAAKVVHHAYIGGLLEHTLAVTELCDFLSSKYNTLNRDLLLTSAICHDIGKTKEISLFPENDYTDDGNLLGHIYLGAEMIDVQARKIEGFPKELLNELKHCILSHHGKLEFGSPKTPALIEALALSYADDVDAKMRRFSDLLSSSMGGWSDKPDFFLGTKFRSTSVNYALD